MFLTLDEHAREGSACTGTLATQARTKSENDAADRRYYSFSPIVSDFKYEN